MNFEQGTPLAKRQDRVFDKLKIAAGISGKDYSMLKGNLWVRTAERLAPSNLVIRHLVLLDLLEEQSKNYFKIRKLLSILAPDVWAEGYSYWRYTRPFLKYYEDEFDISFFRIRQIEGAFISSSYVGKDGKLWPAPFGDLRKEPLDEITLQWATNSSVYHYHTEEDIKLHFLYKGNDIYILWPYILGFNTHSVTKKNRVEIFSGIPQGFKWYTGYPDKYSSKKEELKDTFLNPRRIASAIFKKFGRR